MQVFQIVSSNEATQSNISKISKGQTVIKRIKYHLKVKNKKAKAPTSFTLYVISIQEAINYIHFIQRAASQQNDNLRFGQEGKAHEFPLRNSL